jgi:hypothetical protein
MPSLNDIPAYLQSLDAKTDFLSWLRRIPVDRTTKTALISLWAHQVECTLKKIDYIQAGL